jgi:hypothetical protein
MTQSEATARQWGAYTIVGGGMCPEQYDVFCDGKDVGYIRVRHGHLRVSVPFGGKTVFEAYPEGDGFFEIDERERFLSESIAMIDEELTGRSPLTGGKVGEADCYDRTRLVEIIQAILSSTDNLLQDMTKELSAGGKLDSVLTCVYCGKAYPPGTPSHGSSVLTDHIKVCKKHPLRTAEARIKRQKKVLHQAYRFVLGTACCPKMNKSELKQLGIDLANWKNL